MGNVTTDVLLTTTKDRTYDTNLPSSIFDSAVVITTWIAALLVSATVVTLEAADAAAAEVAMSVTVTAPMAHIVEIVAPHSTHQENCAQSRFVWRTRASSECLSRAAESWPMA